MSEALSLARLIERFADGLEVYDASFARTLAASLDNHAGRVRFPTIDELGLTDVVVTFRMDGRVALVVTGRFQTTPGEVTVHFDEGDLPDVAVNLLDEEMDDPYLFATLDHRWRGRPGRLHDGGAMVEIRALSTIGAKASWRIRDEGGSRTVPADALTLLDET